MTDPKFWRDTILRRTLDAMRDIVNDCPYSASVNLRAALDAAHELALAAAREEGAAKALADATPAELEVA